MNLDRLSSIVSRVCFVAGFVLLALTVLEELALWSGRRIVGPAYTPDTLLQIAAVLFIVVIALLLRQVREALTKSST